ncbi:MAG: SUMF1/EgtB/PvdO family nonheme iron enzyme [Bacteroidaceae bacterium]|nr:SUMF1/EgtB/PvdO family nonheme iron enzyme [Bacteroidaceae bacterium]
MLVLDCSSSLGDQFSTMQNSAKSFINTLVNGSEEDDNGGGSGNNNVSGEPSDIFVSLSYDDMVYVEGGTFKMGAQWSSSSSNYDSDALSNEMPVHSVTLSSYYIGKYEVTQQLWEYVMNYTGTAADGSTMTAVATDPWLGDNPSSTYGKGNYYPAYYVSYYDIVDYFIPRLNKITGKTFRLPTEAEWEYAARGGNQSKGYKYSGSNAIGDVAWYADNASYMTHPVGTKSPNELGIYDMSGNVFEWCSDWEGSYSSTAQTNPTGASSGSNRVWRGGSWYFDAQGCRVSMRSGYPPSSRGCTGGFRLVLSETNKDYILNPSNHQTGNYTSFSSGIYTINSKYDIPIIIDNGPTKYFNDISTVYSHYISTPPGSTIEFNAPEAGILTICVLPTERTNDPNYPSFAPNVVYIKVTQDQGEEVKIGDFSTSYDYSYNDGGVCINYTYTVKVPMAGKVTIMSENTYNTYDNFYYIEFRP